MSLITLDQALKLAPDATAQKAAQALASPRKWQALGRSTQALWGLCQGSGKDPYQVRVALADFASGCTCPSRKFPCKHALGLLLIAAQQLDAFTEGEAPAFVREWLDKRTQRTEKQVAKHDAVAADPEAAAKQAVKREAQRDQRIADGLNELRAWMEDLVSRGFAHAKVQEPAFWDERARRLVDAQAPALGRAIGDLVGSTLGRTDWPTALLRRLSLLHLCLEAYARRDALDPATRADLERVIGIPQRQEHLDPAATITDSWLCVGVVLEEFDRLRMQRTWLIGRNSRRIAMILDFAPGKAPIPVVLGAGEETEVAVSFYPGRWPLRAVLAGEISARRIGAPPEAAAIADALVEQARMRAADAWLEPTPCVLSARIAQDAHGDWWLIDAFGGGLPLTANGLAPWEWLAHTRAEPAIWFGEWRDGCVRPLHVWPRAHGAAP